MSYSRISTVTHNSVAWQSHNSAVEYLLQSNQCNMIQLSEVVSSTAARLCTSMARRRAPAELRHWDPRRLGAEHAEKRKFMYMDGQANPGLDVETNIPQLVVVAEPVMPHAAS
ncbi:hypothetical protein ACJQWK_03947 [Exserohilum turcicum]